jgi:sec-independent protein translocase protein TatA
MPGGPELVFILIIVLLLFGGSQLPKLARNIGKAQKEFKDGIAEADKPSAVTSADVKNDSTGAPTSDAS